MLEITPAGSTPEIAPAGRSSQPSVVGSPRGHAIDRVDKLRAVTVMRGAAPAEASFAERQADVLITQFGLGEPTSAGTDPEPQAVSPVTVAAAYRQPEGDRRSKSALRFVDFA
jgi:hypothetical protein